MRWYKKSTVKKKEDAILYELIKHTAGNFKYRFRIFLGYTCSRCRNWRLTMPYSAVIKLVGTPLQCNQYCGKIDKIVVLRSNVLKLNHLTPNFLFTPSFCSPHSNKICRHPNTLFVLSPSCTVFSLTFTPFSFQAVPFGPSCFICHLLFLWCCWSASALYCSDVLSFIDFVMLWLIVGWWALGNNSCILLPITSSLPLPA